MPARQNPPARSALASDFDTFLRMLTTQMQNQDPLNPIDSTDYATQLATFSGVEQQVRTNSLLADLGTWLAETDMIITWGPDGGYGHADHRMVSALTTQVVQSMPAATRPKLLYVGIPNGTLPPLPQMASWATTDPALLTETIAYTASDLAAATTAAQCHETQFDAYSRDGMMAMFDGTIWRGKVHFRPAF